MVGVPTIKTGPMSVEESLRLPPWAVLPELGIRVSDKDRPEPDVLVIPSDHRSIDARSETLVT